ncbi:hypothetical protein NDU88_003562 [Pleurodeles waltl]|uniref:Uncharacterized protein n=1 Tax=Pleurodeles waltl TaxID=8319 RepID=A0AAV7MUM5_PLEWA|nr:hypothetical protein NDU88_003562 [Pleurodeles waltl]
MQTERIARPHRAYGSCHWVETRQPERTTRRSPRKRKNPPRGAPVTPKDCRARAGVTFAKSLELAVGTKRRRGMAWRPGAERALRPLGLHAA